MNRRFLSCAVACLAVGSGAIAAGQSASLKSPSAFDGLTDERTRSVALFVEAARVITSPRCLNCHPATREPTQGDDLHTHVPATSGGPVGLGVPGLPCRACHGPANAPTLAESIVTIPGNPAWSLAPASMPWQGRTLREICLQIKDPARNGHRTLAQISRHMATDAVVGWSFDPGEGRTPPPGTRAEFTALIDAWIATGAECPQP